MKAIAATPGALPHSPVGKSGFLLLGEQTAAAYLLQTEAT